MVDPELSERNRWRPGGFARCQRRGTKGARARDDMPELHDIHYVQVGAATTLPLWRRMGRAASCVTFPGQPHQLREVPFDDAAPGIVPRRRAFAV